MTADELRAAREALAWGFPLQAVVLPIGRAYTASVVALNSACSVERRIAECPHLHPSIASASDCGQGMLSGLRLAMGAKR